MRRAHLLVLSACVMIGSCGTDPQPRVDTANAQDSSVVAKPIQKPVTPSRRETRPGDNDSASYIRRVFAAQVGEVPRLGWIESSERFLATERLPSIALYGPAGSPASAQFQTVISGAEQTELRRTKGLACEEPDTGLAVYRLNYRGDVVRQNQALFTARPFQNYDVSNLLRRTMTADEIASTSSILKWPAQSLRRDEIVAIADDSAFYSVHQLFGQDSVLTKEAMLLLGRDGTVVAYELVDHEGAELCDGCGLPEYKHGYGYAYNVENLFRLHGFAYPVLLLDTSTFEGRALSLVTFTPDLLISEFRVYEYVVNCHRTTGG